MEEQRSGGRNLLSSRLSSWTGLVAVIILLLFGGFALSDAAVRPAHADGFVVTNTNDSGEGSLRDAIEQANATPGPDTITFDLAGGGPHVINIESSLTLTGAGTTIDGTGANVKVQAGAFVALDVRASSVTLIGFEVVSAAKAVAVEPGATPCAGAITSAMFINMRIETTDPFVGLTLCAQSVNFVTINGTTITGFAGLGISGGPTTSSGQAGGLSVAVKNLTVEDSVLAGQSGSGSFIAAAPGNDVSVENLTVRNSTVTGHFGIHIGAGGRVIAKNMLVEGSKLSGVVGIAIASNTVAGSRIEGVTVRNNDYVKGGVGPFPGVQLSAQLVDGVAIEDNTTISGGSFGVLVGGVAAGTTRNVSISTNGTISGGAAGVQVGGAAGTARNVSISGNGTISGGAGSTQFGVAVLGLNVSQVAIDDNTAISGGAAGVALGNGFPPNFAATISNVSVSGNGSIRAAASAGIVLIGAANSNVTVSNNQSISGVTAAVSVGAGNIVVTNSNISVTGNASVRASNGPGISLAGNATAASSSGISVTDNDVVGGTNGVIIRGTSSGAVNLIARNIVHDSATGVNLIGASDARVQLNNIAGNGTGLRNDDPNASVEAACNWWGSANGPVAPSNPAGTGDSIVGLANFRPWLAAAYPGAQATGCELGVLPH